MDNEIISLSSGSDNEISLKTTLCGFALESCIYNASGPLCTTEAELSDLANSESSAILTKSCTLEPRIGNLGRRYYENDISSINSTGLANLGYKFYGEMADRFSRPKRSRDRF